MAEQARHDWSSGRSTRQTRTPGYRRHSRPPSNSKGSMSKHMSHEIVAAKRGEFRLELAESRRSVPEWTTHRGAVCGQGWADPVFTAASRAYIVPWCFEDYARLPRAPFIDDPHLSLPPSPPAGHLWLYGFGRPPWAR